MAANKTEFTPTWYIDSASIVTEGGRWIPCWGVNPDKEIIGVPRLTSSLGADWEIVDHLFFNPSVRTMFRQPMFKNGAFQADLAAAGDSAGQAIVNSRKNSYWTHVNNWFIDAGISYTDAFFKGLDVGVSVKNIADNDTEQSQSFNTGTNVWRGRTFDITVRYRF
jgi:hypothetical protein